MRILVRSTANQIKIGRLQCGSYWPALTGTNNAAIIFSNMYNLSRSATKESLITNIDLIARDTLLMYLYTLIFGECEYRITGNTI